MRPFLLSFANWFGEEIAVMEIRFDENDDVVVENIPDDIMANLNNIAKRNDRTVEDEMRDVLIKPYGRDTKG